MNIVLATHGRLGEQLVASAGMIFGEMNVPCVSLMPGMSFEEFTAQADQVLSTLEGETLVLVDLFGGTPSNVFSALTRKYGHHVVTGANLLGLIEAYTAAQEPGDKTAAQLADEIVEVIQSSAVHTNKLLEE